MAKLTHPIIGLTGGIAAGKSSVSRLFSQLGITVFNADHIGRTLLDPPKPAFQAIVGHYGETIVEVDGTINRRKLRHHLFTHPNDRLWLESLLQPLILEQLQQSSSRYTPPPPHGYLIWEVPLLLEAGWQCYTQAIIVVDTPSSQQLSRLCQRDQLTEEQAQIAIASQLSRSERLAAADYIIDNSHNESALRTQVVEIHQQLIATL